MGDIGSSVKKKIMTISCQNNMHFQPIVHIFKVFKSSNLSVLQFINNFANLCERSISMKKERDFLSLLLSRKRITFSLPRAENFSVFNVRFQFFKCFFQQVLTPVTFLCPESSFVVVVVAVFSQKGSEI